MTDETPGKAKHLKGGLKEKAGEALGDASLEREGRLEQVEGRAEQDEERAAEKAREARARKERAERARELED